MKLQTSSQMSFELQKLRRADGVRTGAILRTPLKPISCQKFVASNSNPANELSDTVMYSLVKL